MGMGKGSGGHGWWRGCGLGEREMQDARGWMGACVFYINGGLMRIIKRGSRGGICDGCLLICGY